MPPQINVNLITTNVAIIATVLSVASALGVYWYQRRKRNQIPTEWVPVGKVTKLYLHPLKSGRRVELPRAECTEVGLQQCQEDSKVLQLRDRSFVVYGESNNEFKTGRTYPKMVLIETSVHDDKHVAFDAPGMRQLYVKLPNPEENTEVEIVMRAEKIKGLDCGNEAATWLSRYMLGAENGVRLCYFDARNPRDISKAFVKYFPLYPNLNNEATGLFSDISSYLIINEKSVTDVSNRIGENSELKHENFRPNIVVDGENMKAYEEDAWDWIKIGDAVFRVTLPCTRCVLTTVNHENGTFNKDREPLSTLEKFRKLTDPVKRKLDPSPRFGEYVTIKRKGIISVNDTIYIGKI